MSKHRPERVFYWRWPVDGQAWLAWAFQNYGSKWIIWRIGPINYRVQVAEPGESGGWIGQCSTDIRCAKCNAPLHSDEPQPGDWCMDCNMADTPAVNDLCNKGKRIRRSFTGTDTP